LAAGGDPKRLDGFGFYGGGLRAYRDSVLMFMALSPVDREGRVLRRFGRTELHVSAMYDTSRAGYAGFANALADRMDSLDTSGIVSALLDLVAKYPQTARNAVENTLGMMGGERALAGLRSPAGLAALPGDTLKPWHPIQQIAARLGGSTPRPRDFVAYRITRPDTGVSAARITLKGPYGGAFLSAFETLTKYDPEPVVEFFATQATQPARSWSGPTDYTLAAYFGWRCGRDRLSMFRRLLRAREPVVRVAGAVYLAYEDSVQGLEALRRSIGLEGFPGFWARVVLASRGDAGVVEEALEAFNLSPTSDDRHHNTALQARLLVLLSNSARVSGLGQPPSDYALFNPRDRGHQKAMKALRKWWKHAKPRIQLRDPWLDQFAKQKVD
jgi:hypothetical protein